jgi:hypothetical protein
MVLPAYRTALALLAALPLFGQPMSMTSSNYSNGPGGARGSATFSVGPRMSMPTIKNAPYAGQQVTETKQTLIDGTNITRQIPHTPKTWRDSLGRVRSEGNAPGPGMQTPDGVPAFVQINDPVAGCMYILDNINHVAHRVAMNAANESAPRFARPAGAGTQTATDPVMTMRTGGFISGSGVVSSVPNVEGRIGTASSVRPRPEVTTEDLGTKMIDGVLTTGTRRTTIIPEGMQGNDRPMKTTSESWVSKDLQLTLLTTDYSPLNGTTTTRYENFSTAEPDPSLFMVPGNYSVVDEKESFTIKWGEQ